MGKIVRLFVNSFASMVVVVLLGYPWILPARAAGWVTQSAWPGSNFKGVSFWDQTTGVAAGYEGAVARTTDGGKTWVNATFNPAVHFHDVTTAPSSMAYAVGLNGVLYASTDRGLTWAPRTSGTAKTLRGVTFIDATTGWVAGDGGTILKTSDGGQTWVSQPIGSTGTLQDIFFIDPSTGWVAGDNGLIYQTVNGGSSWTPQASGVSTTLRKVFFTNASTGFAVGWNRTILKTTNGGATWTSLSTFLAPADEDWMGLWFADSLTGYLVGSGGKILTTINGGETWALETSGTVKDLTGVAGVPGSGPWVVGYNNIMVIYDNHGPAAVANLALTGGGEYTGNASPSFTWSAAVDDFSTIASYWVAFDSGVEMNLGAATTYTVPTPLPQGTHTFSVRAKDSAYNVGSASTVSFTVDTTSPVVGSITPTAASTGAEVTVTAPVTDGSTIASCTLIVDDAGQGAMTVAGGIASRPYTFGSAGTVAVYARCRDAAGNEAAGSSVNVTVSDASVPLPPPPPVSAAGRVTNDADNDERPEIVLRRNGELVILFNSARGTPGTASMANNPWGIYAAASQDQGTTWGSSWYAFNAWGRFGLIEDAGGKLILLVSGNATGGYGLLTLTSTDGRTFANQRKVTPTAVNDSVGSILQARDGFYYVSYSNDAPIGVNKDVWVTRSLDLITWEPAVRISTSPGFDTTSTMAQGGDGRLYLVYVSTSLDLKERYVAVASSSDGRTWSQPARIAAIPSNGFNLDALHLVELASKPVLFYGASGFAGGTTVYELYSSVGGTSDWSAPKRLATDTSVADAVMLRDGATVGIAYVKNTSYPMDVFFTTLPSVNVTGTTPTQPVSSAPAVAPTPIATITTSPLSAASPTPTSPVSAPDLWSSKEKTLVVKVDRQLTQRLKGRILLQTEERGEAWYVNPTTEEKYYLRDGAVAYTALRRFGLGVRNVDLAKIPVGLEDRFADTDTDGDGLADKLEEGLKTDPANQDSDGDGNLDGVEVRNGYNPLGSGKLTVDLKLVGRLQGRILLQVESRGEAWYLNPADGKRYYLKDGDAAYQIMRFLSLGITNSNLRKITVGEL